MDVPLPNQNGPTRDINRTKGTSNQLPVTRGEANEQRREQSATKYYSSSISVWNALLPVCLSVSLHSSLPLSLPSVPFVQSACLPVCLSSSLRSSLPPFPLPSPCQGHIHPRFTSAISQPQRSTWKIASYLPPRGMRKPFMICRTETDKATSVLFTTLYFCDT